MNTYFDPINSVRDLQHILISDKKKIAFLFGAGTSLSKKNAATSTIPGISKLTELIVDEVSKTKKYKDAILEIKIDLPENSFNIETLLSNLEQKYQVIGGGTLNGLNKEEILELIIIIKSQIKRIVSKHEEIIENNLYENMPHVDFSEWIGKADKKYPVEVFTTNYDYFFELGFEYLNIPYLDGFVGAYEPFFYPELANNVNFENKLTKLWKIHGSLGWHLDSKTNKVFRKNSDDTNWLIYPSLLKYNNSKKQPYISLLDRLSDFLRQPDTVLITCGYSFGDEHINERIMSALKSNTNTHVCGLLYDAVWNENEKSYSLTEESSVVKLAKQNSKLSIFGMRNAIIGGRYGTWKLNRLPEKDDILNINLFFDEDGPDEKITLEQEQKGNEQWSGFGELVIPDFYKFVTFLQSMMFQPKESSDE